MARAKQAKRERIGMSLEKLRALDVTVDIETAGKPFGLGRTIAYELARQGKFPCRVLTLGKRFRVTKADLFAALGIPLTEPGASAEEPADDPAQPIAS